MRQNLSSLTDLGKLTYAIECIAHNAILPKAIAEFLIQQGLHELITKPKVHNEPNSKSNTTSKSRLRS